MPESPIEQELNAIRTIIEALQSLETETRRRALSYAMQHLGLPVPEAHVTRRAASSAHHADSIATVPSATLAQHVDIRSLKEQKNPTTDVEMATLVAYYLKHEASEAEHKEEIGTEDVETYFVQAGYPLPANKVYTLPNAKKAGYLENASRGKYRLNSVGHNLVAHGMPRADSPAVTKPKRKRKRTTKTAKKRARGTSRKR